MISDRRRYAAGDGNTLVAAVGAAARAGVDLIQIRERDLEARALVDLVSRCVEATRGTRTRIVVNDRVDVAMAAGAHGVHLRGDSVPASRVREIVPPGFIIGRSVHAVDEAVQVSQGGGLDYLLFGPVFPTSSKPGVPGVGPQALATVAAATALPVLAIGGVTLDTIGPLAATGAAGFAAIGLFADCDPAALPAMIVRASQAFQGRD